MDYSKYKCIKVERKGRILCLTLNRPDRLNAVTPEMHTELATIFADIRKDHDADVVTITGAGRAFCAGAGTGNRADHPDGKTLPRPFRGSCGRIAQRAFGRRTLRSMA